MSEGPARVSRLAWHTRRSRRRMRRRRSDEEEKDVLLLLHYDPITTLHNT